MPSLDHLAIAIAAWQRRTMPTVGIDATMAHMRMEVEELDNALTSTPLNEYDAAEEAADIFFMLVQVCDRAGLPLGEAVAAKMEINLAREWQQPDADGKVHHA